MKLFQTVFLFIFLSFSLLNAKESGIQVIVLHAQKEIALSNSKLEFRKQILLKLLDMYKQNMSIYYYLWKDSNQNINADLVNSIIISSDSYINFKAENNQYESIFRISEKLFNDLLVVNNNKKIAIVDELITRYKDENNVSLLFEALDNLLLIPMINKNYPDFNIIEVIEKINIFVTDIKVIYPDKLLLYKTIFENNKNFELSFMYQDKPLPNLPIKLIDDLGNSRDFISDSKGKVVIKQNVINDNISKLQFEIDFLKYLNYNNYQHSLFMKHYLGIIQKSIFFTIDVLQLLDTSFVINSGSLEEATGILSQKYIELGWINNKQSFNLVINVERVAIEKKQLSIGVYYLKEYIKISYLDNEKKILKVSNLQPVESIDSFSFNNCEKDNLRKMIKQLRSYSP